MIVKLMKIFKPVFRKQLKVHYIVVKKKKKNVVFNVVGDLAASATRYSSTLVLYWAVQCFSAHQPPLPVFLRNQSVSIRYVKNYFEEELRI